MTGTPRGGRRDTYGTCLEAAEVGIETRRMVIVYIRSSIPPSLSSQVAEVEDSANDNSAEASACPLHTFHICSC